MKVLKFGGSSVGTPERIQDVIEIVRQSLQSDRVAVVVSAFQSVTDQLIGMARKAAQGDQAYLESLRSLSERHQAAAKALLSSAAQTTMLESLQRDLHEIQEILHGVFLVRELTARTLDLAMSFGERLCASIVAHAFCDRGIEAECLDARKVLKTDAHFGSARVLLPQSYEAIRAYFENHSALQIVTGFIASTSGNETTTLGRGGSDYSASLFGAALNVTEIEIWTDVDGVLTADPRMVPDATSIQIMTYEEAMELSHFGAKVIHPPTMQPALKANIPIRIKNTFNPSFPGTLITTESSDATHAIRGLSSVSHTVLLRLQGSGMVGIPGIASRLFQSLARNQISVILITQASSEHSICFAVEPAAAGMARSAIEEEFDLEMRAEQIDPVVVEPDRAILAAVGINMRNTPGLAGRLFQALGREQVNVIAIAQGSSELNVSIVIDRKDEVKGMNAIHRSFFSREMSQANIFVVGTGLIGGTLIKQIEAQRAGLKDKQSVNLHVAAIVNSRRMIFDPDSLWKSALMTKGEPSDLLQFVERMKSRKLPNSIFVDCTASDAIPPLYAGILRSGISVVTPNKRANSAEYRTYAAIKSASQDGGVPFLYEANVCAGLPVIGTLQDLVSTGDRILQIEAVLSGTLSFIFNTLSENSTFSETVRRARELGYTEPDPAEDLNGVDVARKLLILAREGGAVLEMTDVSLEPLLPPNLRKPMPVNDFMAQLKSLDSSFEEKRARAAKTGNKLQYVATLKNGCAQIGLTQIGSDHPFFSLSGSDNIVAVTTERYSPMPLVVRGPGAGADVTAAGVFADILRAARWK